MIDGPFSLLPSSCWCFCCALSPWSFTLYTSPLPIFKSHQSCPFLELNSNVIISNWLTMVNKNSAEIKNTALGIKELNMYVLKCPSTLSLLWSPTQKMLEIHYVFCFEEKMALSPFEKGFWRFQKSHFPFLLLRNQNTFCGLELLSYSLHCVRPENLSNFPLFSQGISILVVYLPNWIVFTIGTHSFHLRTNILETCVNVCTILSIHKNQLWKQHAQNYTKFWCNILIK